MAMEEHVQMWLEIRDSAKRLHNAGVNPGDILMWSRKKTLTELQVRLHEIFCECEDTFDKEEKTIDDKADRITHPGDIRENTRSS